LDREPVSAQGLCYPQAAAIARLAVPLLAGGHGLDAEQALPVYLRDKVAFTTSEREAARASA
ncbi:MAG TPA: tRNA (adenosine(37)-N6)-threonylcarbamoyltransferase complex dimerization subunit type 1 TsaB, partial [Dokdonella sp.]|nr:tRNA (adenosine(37)-N6)-threonylcarbamoyltransferase complex dimerization subunit type 1 TsaB [Dokdonella sp.]